MGRREEYRNLVVRSEAGPSGQVFKFRGLTTLQAANIWGSIPVIDEGEQKVEGKKDDGRVAKIVQLTVIAGTLDPPLCIEVNPTDDSIPFSELNAADVTWLFTNITKMSGLSGEGAAEAKTFPGA